ncbi:MAG: hypothetical protein ACM3VS_13735 [Candidatus Dadabacteria bacterium]
MKRVLNYSFLLITIIISILNFSCKKDTITGPDLSNLEPGRRDYLWSVDTLKMPMNSLNSIWGSSPEDVWAVGAGGDFNDRLQHFDGSRWTAYNKEMIICAGNTLFGFSKNDVWMGGQDGEIWHYDGVKWDRNYRYEVDGTMLVNVKNIWGSGPNDIYACGVLFYKASAFEPDSHKGFILHYDGNNWTEICKGDFNSQFSSIRKEKDKVYVFSLSIDQFSNVNDTFTFYELGGSKLKPIYSNTCGQANWGHFELFGKDLLFWINKDVLSLVDSKINGNGTFIKLFTIDNPNFNYYISGRNAKDVFISATDGLAHYNGDDTQYLLHYPETQTLSSGLLLFEKDVFCAFYDYSTNTNMILHGKFTELH